MTYIHTYKTNIPYLPAIIPPTQEYLCHAVGHRLVILLQDRAERRKLCRVRPWLTFLFVLPFLIVSFLFFPCRQTQAKSLQCAGLGPFCWVQQSRLKRRIPTTAIFFSPIDFIFSSSRGKAKNPRHWSSACSWGTRGRLERRSRAIDRRP